jgi:hypothetical protein
MRTLGAPARLVVGFEPTGPVVRARDVRVWVELRYAAAGWVRYDPTPPPTRAGASDRREVPAPPPAPVDTPTAAATAQPESPAGPVLPLRPLIPAAFTLVMLAILFRLARRAWRRRTPGAAVVAAWHDVLQAYAPAERKSFTPALLHERLAQGLPAQAAQCSLILSRLAGRTLYSSRPCAPGDAALARRCATEIRRALRGRTPVRPRRGN